MHEKNKHFKRRMWNRFSDTIVAQFNGHTHYKENIIYYENNDLNKPINVAFNGGSLTAWRNVNPNYVVYDVNPSTSVSLEKKCVDTYSTISNLHTGNRRLSALDLQHN